VDKSEFTKMFVQQSQPVVREKTSGLVDTTSLVIENLKRDCEKEIESTMELFNALLVEETNATKAKLREILKGKDEELGQIESLLDQQNISIFLKLASKMGVDIEEKLHEEGK